MKAKEVEAQVQEFVARWPNLAARVYETHSHSLLKVTVFARDGFFFSHFHFGSRPISSLLSQIEREMNGRLRTAMKTLECLSGPAADAELERLKMKAE
ncbi:MAG: hypothetical protein GY871_04260 [Actinomycetales bacterium]|nr:hypothetical protein [Actinomycetales bacterium]